MERFGSSLVLLDKLAAGGMAEVYRAKQLGHGGFEKIVAIKRILPQYAESEDFKEMFLQEASLSAMLQHPNVIQTYANGEVGGYLFLSMEFVDGKNLRQILAKVDRQKKRIPIEHALFVIAEAAKGLHYAHEFVDDRTNQSMNIVHRDMSPQNVMLGYDGTVKIVDFGIAKIAAQAESTRAGVLKGKFGYMSPEQARGMTLDRRTDVFALGIIIFELLTQRRLFASDDDMRTLRLVKECRIPRPSKYNPSISPQLDQIVLKALAKERSERYSNANELYEDIQRHLQELYPKFMSSDFSKFMRATFVDEIREEKQKREKIQREAPAILDNSRIDAKPEDTGNHHKGNATVVDEDQATQISQAIDPGLDMPELGASSSTNASKSGALFSDAPVANANLQLETSRVNNVEQSVELPPPSDFQSPQKTYVGVAGGNAANFDRPRAPVPPKKRANAAKLRRLMYVAMILIGVIFYLGEQDKETTQVAKAPTAPAVVPTEPKAELPKEETKVAEASPPAAQEPIRSQASEPASEASREPSIEKPVAVVQQEPAAVTSGAALPGYLKIVSYPQADSIIINGEVMKDRSVASGDKHNGTITLAPGRYEVILRNSAYGVSWRGSVTIDSQKISSLQDVVLE